MLDKSQAPTKAGLNDDIGEGTRLELYRLQVLLREAEQRAFDLFLQNLVKGTSHLSLGQEAVATGLLVRPMCSGVSKQPLKRLTAQPLARLVAEIDHALRTAPVGGA